MIKQEVQEKIPYKIYIQAKQKIKSKLNSSYSLELQILLFDKNQILHEWDQTFFWFCYAKYISSLQLDFVKEAEAVFLSMNKSWFYSLKNAKGNDLRAYFLAKLKIFP